MFKAGLQLVSRAVVTLLLAACQTPPLNDATPSVDRLEPGLQGQTMLEDLALGVLPQPYSRGMRVVGHSPVFDRDSNVQMSWVGHCAYIASSSPNFLGWGVRADPSSFGVAVIDVSDATAPRQVRVLRERGAIYAAETMHAVEAPGRSVLAAGNYGGGHEGQPAENAAFLDIYDVSDCANPRLTAEYTWPENVHTVTISPNGQRIYGTHIDPFTGGGGIHVLDISDMAHPRYIGKFGATRTDGTSYEFATHEISISPDERRIYAGVIGSMGGDLNRDITTPPGVPTAARVGRDAGGIYILDNSDIAEGRANPAMRLVGTAEHAGWHSVMQANINGVPYLVGAGELGPCPGAWPRLVNRSDETRPVITGEFRLAMNREENCPPREGVELQTAGISGRPGTASAHFNDVDSADNTRLGLFNFMWAGLRVADLRDPANPVEVAYFKPGDPCTGHVRYMPDTGHIWLVCAASGFYVLELSPDVRAAMGMPRSNTRRRE